NKTIVIPLTPDGPTRDLDECQIIDKPTGFPLSVEQMLWADPKARPQRLYAWGSINSFVTGTIPTTNVYLLLVFTKGDNAGENFTGTWTTESQTPRDYSTWTTCNDVGIMLGGVIVTSEFPYFSSRLVTYNMTTGKWSNDSRQAFPEVIKDENTKKDITLSDSYAAGAAVCLPTMGTGKGDLVFFLAGTQTSANPRSQSMVSMPMTTVHFYDTLTRTFHKQSTSGPGLPSLRIDPCVVAREASNDGMQSSYEIFMLGGQAGGYPASSDVWILTVPGLRWFKASETYYGNVKTDHACAVIGQGRRHMISVWGGGANWDEDVQGADLWTNGIGVYDMTNLSWLSPYKPNGTAYEKPQVVRDWYAEGSLPIAAIVGGVVAVAVLLTSAVCATLLIRGLRQGRSTKDKQQNHSEVGQSPPEASDKPLLESTPIHELPPGIKAHEMSYEGSAVHEMLGANRGPGELQAREVAIEMHHDSRPQELPGSDVLKTGRQEKIPLPLTATMGDSEDLINFDVIEGHKENIQSLPGGRSAKKLAGLFAPSPMGKSQPPTPNDTNNIHDCIRAEYEAELANAADLDDPLDVYDRYVRWTLDAYPSAQATAQSQLHVLLERATKAFIGSSQYKNDPRYLKLWLYYIKFFSDAPRETFLYVSRHGIGEGLALFYEEYAAWLEGAGRWSQAEEVYKLGIDRDARPQQRLVRKLGEFEQRREQQAGDEADAPSSPALPTMRPALAAKMDPFASSSAPSDPQAAQRQAATGSSSRSAKPAKSKLAIFSDADAAPPPALGSREAGPQGWDTIDSLAHRKKENVMEPKSWVGETLKTGSRKPSGPKMAVFRDTSLLMKSHIPIDASQHQVTVDPRAGKRQRIVFDLRVLYPTPEIPGSELSFEEVLLARAGWLDERPETPPSVERKVPLRDETQRPSPAPSQVELLDENTPQKLLIHRDTTTKSSSSIDTKVPLKGENNPSSPLASQVDLLDENAPQKLVIHRDTTKPSPPVDRKVPLKDENHRSSPVTSQVDLLDENAPQKLVIHRDATIPLDENGAPIKPISKEGKPRKKKTIEVNETQIIKAKLDSPSRPKLLKRKGTSEPTMTMHTRAATDDIYDIFNAPIKPSTQDEDEGSADEEDYDTDGDYTSGAESGNTTRAISEAGDDEDEEDDEDDDAAEEDEPIDADDTADDKSVSEWSDFTARKHIPNLDDIGAEEDQDVTRASNLTEQPSPELDPEDDENLEPETPVDDDEDPRTRTTFVPIPPEDYVPERRTYRDPVEMANNRLPFMTPITERTETDINMGSGGASRSAFTKTPSRCRRTFPETSDDEDEDGDAEPPSSPLRDIMEDEPAPPRKALQPIVPKVVGRTALQPKSIPPKGPIIADLQCNPVEESVRAEILSKASPALTSQPRYYDHRPAKYEKGSEIRKFAKALTKAKASGDKTSSLPLQPTIEFPGCEMKYTVKKELGKGAFAPVFLVENSAPEAADPQDEKAIEMGKGAFATAQSQRSQLEALKMETPPSAWEFHMMRLAHDRLGPQHRVVASLSAALEFHLYQDEGFLMLPFHPHGTLLDVVNFFRAEPSGVMDETLAMFFSIELLRTAEALHSKGLLHGDLKADNCLLRLDAPSTASDPSAGAQLSSQWRADGSGGWSSRGVTLIDFGRGIDLRAFRPDVQFVADWKTSPQDCAEMREGRPWTWQIDCHGLAGTIHCLLFGKYIETVRCDANMPGTGGRRYKVRESLKRYWQTDIWGDCFDLLLNPAAHVEAEEGGKMPVLRGMKSVRERMEAWLEGNCERGVGLKSLMGKVEVWAKGRK
ncbi:hypothetical protein PspLS_08448, partial [Pyricularia sp. CBS 133598]